MKKYSYYNIDVGFFPRCVKLCFTDEQFQDALRDQKISSNGIKALDYGLAETHYFSESGTKSVIIVVFNLNELTHGLDELVGAIAHETVHIVDRISDYIGDEDEFSSETRAYLTESLVKQIFKACVIEKEQHARKTSGEVLQTGSGKGGRVKLQVDQHSDRSTGQDSIPQGKSTLSGNESKVRPTVSKTTTRI